MINQINSYFNAEKQESLIFVAVARGRGGAIDGAQAQRDR